MNAKQKKLYKILENNDLVAIECLGKTFGKISDYIRQVTAGDIARIHYTKGSFKINKRLLEDVYWKFKNNNKAGIELGRFVL